MDPFNSYRALSSVYGRIEEILVVFQDDPSRYNRTFITEQFQSFFNSFNDRKTFVILSSYDKELHHREFLQASGKFANDFKSALLESHAFPGHHVIHIPARMAARDRRKKVKKGNNSSDGKHVHTKFIQDPFLVLENRLGQSLLLEPYRSLHPDNSYVAEQVAVGTGGLIRPTELWLEGGNILVGDDFALVGRNLLEMNRRRLFKGRSLKSKLGRGGAKTVEDELTTIFKSTLGVKYINWIGMEKPINMRLKVEQGTPKLQPFFHLDHFLTLCGRGEKGKENILVGKIDIESVEPENLRNRYKEDLLKLNQSLRKITESLRNQMHEGSGPKFEFSDLLMGGKITQTKGKHWFFPFSYNNCLVERYGTVNNIYLPKYPQTSNLEEDICTKLKSLQFNVKPMVSYSLETAAEKGGSLNCVTKILRRSPNLF